MGEPQLTPEVFDRAIVAVALTAGPDHRLVYRNEAFGDLFGPRTLHSPIRDVFTEPGVERLFTLLDLVLADGTARQVTAPRTVQATGDGRPDHRHFVYSCAPATSRFGPGVLITAIDTTEQVHSAQRAEELSTERLYALQRYEALISAVSQLVWLTRPDGSMAELVPGWEALTGHPWRDTMDEGWFEVIHPLDRDGLVQRWVTAATGEPSMFEHTFRLRAAAGGYRHVASRAVPIVRDGRLLEWIGATVDVEDQWRNRLRERLLARAVAVSEATHPEDAFAAVVNLVVPDLTDACTVFLLSGHTPPNGAGELTGTRIASTARAGLPPLPPLDRQTFRLGPQARQAVADRTPVLLTFPAGRVPDGLVPEESARWLDEAGATSLTLLPVVIDGSAVALAAAAGCEGNPPPGRADIDLLQEVLQHAQTPLRQALELQRTRHTALVLQRALLTEPPRVPGAEIAARYQPSSRTAEVGGDWYDAFVLPDDSLALTIGDVAGHDLTAATTMGQLRSMLRAVAYNRTHLHTPADTLAGLDAAAEGLGVASFATAVHLHLARAGEGWTAAWSNAGHPPPLLVPARGEPRLLAAPDADVPLCVAPGEPRRTHRTALGPGDTLVLYTDGLVEVPGENLAAGLARLAATAGGARGLPLEEFCDHLLAQVTDIRDDIALIAFRADGLAA
ncbi:SpoIIE family protein phosphatase [Kitasatospora sp. NPDC057223]|uniref:SpoIIE family protein phosphatase n=1 Tax=Kitasatospora sp. NPDC057223 TaxID=3346055 RepID=UPI00363AB7CB